MLHLAPDSDSLDRQDRPAAYADALERLRGVERALRLASRLGDGPAGDEPGTILSLPATAAESEMDVLIRLSRQAESAAVAGLTAVVEGAREGRQANAAAIDALAAHLRDHLAQCEALLRPPSVIQTAA